MSVRKIIEVWGEDFFDKLEFKFLRIPTSKVTFPLEKDVKNIILDLRETVEKIPCLGIAANQIGYNKQVFIGLLYDSKKFKIYINPVILAKTENSLQKAYKTELEHFKMESSKNCISEGCLSFPGANLSFQRYDKIKVEYYDEKGKQVIENLNGILSHIFQHEFDHLNGVTVVDRLNSARLNSKPGSILPDGFKPDIPKSKYIELYDRVNRNFERASSIINDKNYR
jgi:peptide deformylase